MHATISQQIMDLNTAGTMVVPTTDFDNIAIRETVSGTLFIYVSEIKNLINALEILGVTDITAFSGTFDISALALEADQNTLLMSASMHATISKTLFDLGDAVLIIPVYSQLGEIEANRIQKTVSLTDFIIKSEIKSLINAFLIMGYTDLNSFGASIDSSKFFDDPDTLLLSSSIQATLSDKLINGTGGNLIIPNTNFAGDYIIRIEQTAVTYVEINEMKAILHALELLGLTDFSAISISPANVFAADFDELLASYSMQATISATLLDGADSDGSNTGNLIVPNFFRETLNVGLLTEEQINVVELKALLTSLQKLGVTDFGGAMDASIVTSLSDADLDIVLASGSMQVTIDDMLQDNPNIIVPAYATEDVFGLTGVTTKAEIKAFIKATNTIDAGDISNVNFDLTAIEALDAGERDIVLDSMIVRNQITPDLETMCMNPFDTYVLTNADYENSDPANFLIKTTILAIFTHYGI